MYVEILDNEEITAKELQEAIKCRVLSQCALNGTCFLKEEASRIIDTDGWSDEQFDSRPTNFIDKISDVGMWEDMLSESKYDSYKPKEKKNND